MPRFAANLSLLYTEHDFLDRFAAAAADGFEAVEFLFPYDHAPAALAGRLADAGLRQVLFNAPPGDWNAGERGIACLPGREDEFRRGVERALAYAEVLACPRIHLMAGIAPPGVERARLDATYRANLAWACAQAGGRELLIEPINPRDMPGYLLNRQDDAHRILAEVGAPGLKVQMDLYHCQIVEGEVASLLRRYLPTGNVAHLQIAGVPDRHEPDDGELDCRLVFDLVDSLSAASGWTGWVGCEYRPRAGAVAGGTTRGLGWRPASAVVRRP